MSSGLSAIAAQAPWRFRRTTATSFGLVPDPGPHACGTTPEPSTGGPLTTHEKSAHGDVFWAELRDVARRVGWDIVG